MQTKNSSSSDSAVYTKTPVIVLDPAKPEVSRLATAFAVIKTNCIGCHSGMNLTTDAAWLDSGYIAKGSPTTSVLYCRIQGSGCGAQDMPKDSTISADDLNKIKVWIEGI